MTTCSVENGEVNLTLILFVLVPVTCCNKYTQDADVFLRVCPKKKNKEETRKCSIIATGPTSLRKQVLEFSSRCCNHSVPLHKEQVERLTKELESSKSLPVMVKQYSLVSLLCHLLALVAPSPDSARHLEYVLKGQEINFLPSIPGKPDLLGWIHDGRDVVWFDLQMGKDVFPPYEDRITLEQESARLTIKDATYEDSGNYDLKLMINEQHHRLKFRIEVIDKVDQPHISCVLTSPNRVLLVCSTDSKHPDLLEFKWSSVGKEQPGPNLQINVRGKHDDRVYRCDVSNPLTKETTNFTAGDCFLEPFEKTKKRIRRGPCNTPDVSQDLKYVLKGQEINFKPSIPEKPDQIFWVHPDGRGVVLFDDKGELNFPSYKDRIILDHNTAELTINNATYEDSGSYILRWNINNEECRLKYPVEVIDKVTKPNISCKMVDQNQAFLECLTEGKRDPLLKFKWRSQGTEQTGPILKINLSDEQDAYHCDVSNPLTNETASFLAKDCFVNKIPQEGIFICNDMTSLIITGIMSIVLGFFLGFIVCSIFPCSERFKIIRAKRFERQETTEVESPSAAIEMKPLVTLGTNQTRKRNLRSGRKSQCGQRNDTLSETHHQ